MNELTLTIQIKVEPDLTKLVKSTRKLYHDLVTNEPIEKGSEAYKLSYRRDGKLYAGYVSVATYQSLTGKTES